jgi:hypothetical protein
MNRKIRTALTCLMFLFIAEMAVLLLILAVDAFEYEATGECRDCILLQYMPHIAAEGE